MESAALVTFYDLLLQGQTVAQLATAVEKHGVIGPDRFGRVGLLDPSPRSGDAMIALDLLKDYLDFEKKHYEERSSDYDETEVDATAALEAYDEITNGVMRMYGWERNKIPPMSNHEEASRYPRSKRRGEEPKNSALIIGVLLEFIALRDRPPSQAQIIDAILLKHPHASGLKKSTLEKWFSEANNKLRELRSSESSP